MMSDIEFRLTRTVFGIEDIELHARIGESYLDTTVFSRKEEGVYIPPAMGFSLSSAQGLMDELWSCGIRPSEGQGSAGQLSAVQSHLSDMKTIAFSQLKIKDK